jgi:hypothetical protein
MRSINTNRLMLLGAMLGVSGWLWGGTDTHACENSNWWPGFASPPNGKGLNYHAWAMVPYNGTLIIGGLFTRAGNNTNANYIGRWNGLGWTGLQGGMDANVNALLAVGTDLYAGGAFQHAGIQQPVSAAYIARWNGTSWQPVGAGMNDHVLSLALFGSMLVAGGWFTQVEGNPANLIAIWDGSQWSALGGGLAGGDYPRVKAIAEFDGKLYAGGSFTEAGGLPVTNLAQWDGASWSDFGTTITVGQNFWGDPVEVLFTEFNGNLTVGGNFSHINGQYCNGLAEWDGSSWTPLGIGLSADAAVLDATVYHGDLVVFGYLSLPGEIPGEDSRMIARWNGASWGCFGTGLGTYDIWGGSGAAAVYDGDLYAGGNIQSAGGNESRFIARWTDPSTAVSDLHAGESDWAVRVVATPSRGAAEVELTVPEFSNVVVDVLDVGARRLMRMDYGDVAPGVYRKTWDGRDASGEHAAAGVYFLRLSAAAEMKGTAKVVLQR